MPANQIINGPEDAPATLLLAHGAGGAMDSPAMNEMALAISAAGLRVMRFEFAYMATRRHGLRKPPPKAETLIPEYQAAVESLNAPQRLIIGGKSMGGRIASMIADDLYVAGRISGLVCIGYPFHPPARPERLRTAHLEGLRTPTLIAQGTRDPFGTREEVSHYALSDAIGIDWFEDGDHDLKPRKSVSGFTAKDHLARLARDIRAFSDSLRG